jgi:hypothetical protein
MSALSQALTYITGFFTPPTTSEALASESPTNTGPGKPEEAGESYFPTTSSRRSSLSSTSTGSQESLPAKLLRSHTGANPLDAMSREYPEPTQEIDVAKQLAMQPRKHSLHHSLKRAAATERMVVVEDSETKAKKLAAAKAELLALAGKA